MGLSFRRPSSFVTWLIVANVAVFFIDTVVTNWILAQSPGLVSRVFGLSLAGVQRFYFWQPLTYMFLHGGTWHLLVNMLGLYIFGSEFERHFGSQKFLQFYAICGLIGGLAYLLLALFLPDYARVPLVGASGAIFGLLIAAVIFFPHIQVVLFIFPVPIRVFGLIVAAMLLLQLLGRERIDNVGGQVCHLAGALTGLGVFYAWGALPGGGRRFLPRLGRAKLRQGAWARRQQRAAAEQAEVDRILEKVHRTGINSLSWGERRTLSRATRRQRERDRSLDRVDRL